MRFSPHLCSPWSVVGLAGKSSSSTSGVSLQRTCSSLFCSDWKILCNFLELNLQVYSRCVVRRLFMDKSIVKQTGVEKEMMFDV